MAPRICPFVKKKAILEPVPEPKYLQDRMEAFSVVLILKRVHLQKGLTGTSPVGTVYPDCKPQCTKTGGPNVIYQVKKLP
ncbi:MAG: hypothetical protein COB67_07940 [SAR324 cluster bacterium]|uniref:Uncharacterized protein n=1 Tax=SAR324 cluster bacterium TaxID=2024889 RepID=A0A2A4T2B6_9DELT|nr:MAG: hypothetical protein COB67_07940 [SAR324 cluster bacterium]